MNELPLKWRLFRLLCIFQMILAGFHGALWIYSLVLAGGGWLALLGISVFGAMLYFLYMGLSFINYNYPDNPLSPQQKKRFNWLFLLNFLSIAFLFATLLSEWKNSIDIFRLLHPNTPGGYLAPFTFLIAAAFLFIFHLLFLVGMIGLRRELYRNTEEAWQKQFGSNEKS